MRKMSPAEVNLALALVSTYQHPGRALGTHVGNRVSEGTAPWYSREVVREQCVL